MSDVMRSGESNPVVNVNDSMTNLLIEMSRKWTGAVSVVNAKKVLVGLVTDYDVSEAFAQGKAIRSVKIRQIMNPTPTYIYSDEMAVRALEIMETRKKPLTVLPVVDRRLRSVGMVHLHDLVRSGLVSGKDSPL
jgi:arabinose-5-phosphate isomerase